MRKWARIGIVVLVVFLVGVVGWASTSWSDTQPLVTSPEVGPKSVTYRCGALFGSPTVHRTTANPDPYPQSRPPCRDRTQRQVLAYGDIVLAIGGMFGLALLSRRYAEAGEPPLPAAPA